MSGKELLIRFTARAFHKLVSVYVFSYFPLGFEGRIWDLIVSVPDHCLSFYFKLLDFCCTSVSIVVLLLSIHFSADSLFIFAVLMH